ncbi:type VI secretion protein [Desulfuromonas versatilis]|uniref:Type VI secretion protein n=1 Tax=Desulfuromonas versatilis TaxID=2802975 RepID=A0ABM8HNF6_9BACT|nr:type VI secretion system baseplate subunit TssG [Desulfuromonas versatilis]BCR03023.1 type VI secretion protein [Desulfuromonas versatilis]
MGTAAWGKFPALIRDLLEHPAAYDFYQAVRLVEVCSGGERRGPRGLQGPIRMRPAPETCFPAADIRRSFVDEQGRINFELNFMGLYGVDAPLPHYFIEAVAAEDEAGQVLRAFLDVFNRRLYELLYLAWKKFHLPVSGDGQSTLYQSYLAALSGQANLSDAGEEPAYAGLLGSRVKNAAGLAGLLGEFLQCPVQVRQHVPCWVELDSTASLGGGEPLVLGENSLLGERVLDLSRKIAVVVGPVSLEKAAELLPGQQRAAELGELIRQYLDPTLLFDVELLIQAGAGNGLRLGGQEAILGWTACLGVPGAAVNKIHLPGSSFKPSTSLRRPETNRAGLSRVA